MTKKPGPAHAVLEVGRPYAGGWAAPGAKAAAREILGRALAPRLGRVTPAARFGLAATASATSLGQIPQAVVLGFEAAMCAFDVTELHQRLAFVDVEYRGFAYEGAAMAVTICDRWRHPERRWAASLLTGPGERHLLLNYIGIGFAMARLPRRLWTAVIPPLTTDRRHPTLSWLAVDGYGFDLAYFRPSHYLRGGHRPASYGWLGDSTDYFQRAADQGVGRALWFATGGSPSRCATRIDDFEPSRRADLWSGVGLACVFTGGTDIASLPTRAGPHRAHLQVGAVLAAYGRHSAGHIPPHTVSALQDLTGLTPSRAAAMTDAFEASDWSSSHNYEAWRTHLRGLLLQVQP